VFVGVGRFLGREESLSASGWPSVALFESIRDQEARRASWRRTLVRFVAAIGVCAVWLSALLGNWEWSFAYHDRAGISAFVRWHDKRTPETEKAWLQEKARMDERARLVRRVRLGVLLGGPVAAILLARRRWNAVRRTLERS